MKGEQTIKQFFTHYSLWEDYQNGMYCGTVDNDYKKIHKAKWLLSTPLEFEKTMLDLFENWPISTKVNLTNLGVNRRAWIGQASCCYRFSVPEILTRIAWNELNEQQQQAANKVAEHGILLYERKLLNHAQITIAF
jgi:hypothetical protein